MKLKTSYLYQIGDMKKNLICFYAIYFTLIIGLFCILPMFLSNVIDDGSPSLTGMEAATSVFLIIVTLEVFKGHLFMLIQNGISRKSYFIGRILTIASIALFMSIIDVLFFSLFEKMTTKLVGNLICYSLYESIYQSRIADNDTILNLMERASFHFFVYLMVTTGALLISIIYYRLNKTFRIMFCAGIPILLFIIFPVFDYSIFQGKLSNEIADFINFIMGITANQPLRGVFTLTISSLIFGFLSWITMRKVSIKD